MWHRRRRFQSQHRSRSSCRACSGSNTAATTPAASPCTPAACSARAPPRAWPTCWTQVRDDHIEGSTGIAHTRWATHGAPAVHNAHPHFSHGPGATPSRGPAASRWCTTASSRTTRSCARALQAKGYVFESQTDTEVIAHLVDSLLRRRPVRGRARPAVQQLHGAYAIAVICRDEPHRVVGARAGSPLILGVGKEAARTSSPATRWRWPA